MKNCLIVALGMWISSRLRGFVWARRSRSFRGWIPHFGYAESAGDHLIVVEYVPPEDRLWTKDNVLILFRGKYRTSVLTPAASAEYKTSTEALSWARARAMELGSSSASFSASPCGASPTTCLECGHDLST